MAAAASPAPASVSLVAIADKAQKDFRAITATKYESGLYGGTVGNGGLYVRWTCIVICSGLAVCIVAAAGSDKMGIGTLGGWMFGATVVNVHDFVKDFLAWKQRAQKKVLEDVVQSLMDASIEGIDNDVLFCAINMTFPEDPVKTPYSPHVYERAAIERHLQKSKTCPMTRRDLEANQLRPHLKAQAALPFIVLELIRSSEVQNKYRAKSADLQKLGRHCTQLLQNCTLKEIDRLRGDLDSGRITLKVYAESMRNALESMTHPLDLDFNVLAKPGSGKHDVKRDV